MGTSPPSHFLKSKRKDTDESLVAEREKATESLKTARDKTQNQTDQIVKDERSIADQKTTISRTDHDEIRESTTHGLNTKVNQNQLANERRRSDSATELERSRIDAAIVKERTLANELVNTVLDRERELTDKSLLAERESTDSHVKGAASLLKTEAAEHAKTKISLTSRDEFLAIVSHDLRNPLGAIRSYAEILLEEATPAQFSLETKKYIEAIKRNADVSLRLISDLLDVERIAQDKLQLDCQSWNLNTLIRESIETFSIEASEKNIHLAADSSSASIEVTCDHDRILQVLFNLIGNALKFTPDGGQIIISDQVTNKEAQVSVRDNGPGIPEEKKDLIFERFAQITSNDRNGLGLGLYISKMLIQAHHGRIWVESQIGTGSTFSFAIPV